MEAEEKNCVAMEINDGSELEDGELEDDSDDEPVKDRRITYGDKTAADKSVLLKRAERFGAVKSRKLPDDPDLRKIHIAMGVDGDTRTEALHLYGTDSMQTQDVFQYFDPPPASVEWLSTQSCNAVWLDEETCARALMNRTVRILGQGCSDDSEDEEESVDAGELRCALPPGGVWRKGRTRSFAPNLLVRFARVSDKKEMRLDVPQSLKMKEMMFPDGGDETAKKVLEQDDDTNPWSGLARQWGKYETASKNRFGVQDARERLKEKELRESLIRKDARDLIKYNRICRLEKGLEPVSTGHTGQPRHPGLGLKRGWREGGEESATRKRPRSSEENLQIIVENDSYRRKPARVERSRPRPRPRSPHHTSSSDSSSTSDSSSSSTSDDSSSSSSSSDEDDHHHHRQEESKPAPPPPSLRTPWNRTTNKFVPESSLRIEIDNDLCRRKHRPD